MFIWMHVPNILNKVFNNIYEATCVTKRLKKRSTNTKKILINIKSENEGALGIPWQFNGQDPSYSRGPSFNPWLGK